MAMGVCVKMITQSESRKKKKKEKSNKKKPRSGPEQ